MTGDERYSGAAIALHWVTALLIVANLALGLSMVPLPLSPRKLQWYQWHKWIGITVFLLTCGRLAWHAVRPPPPPVPMAAWQRRAATFSHGALYVLLLVIPLSGWVYSSATGVQVVYLGVFPLPDLVAKDRSLGDALRVVHLTLDFALLALVCIHAIAALKHHYVDRDTALTRILPMRSAASAPSSKRAQKILLLAGAVLMAGVAADPSLAQGVLVDKSDIRFVSKQMGVNIEGSFRKWSANVVFLPTNLARSKADIEVQLASIDLASAESDQEARGAVWFDTARFPVARFTSTSIRDLGGGKYEVAGHLAIKGTTKPTTVPISVTKDAAGNRIADGTFTIKRLDYKIGEGLWADTDTVANEVLVRIRMVLTSPG